MHEFRFVAWWQGILFRFSINQTRELRASFGNNMSHQFNIIGRHNLTCTASMCCDSFRFGGYNKRKKKQTKENNKLVKSTFDLVYLKLFQTNHKYLRSVKFFPVVQQKPWPPCAKSQICGFSLFFMRTCAGHWMLWKVKLITHRNSGQLIFIFC